MLVVDDDHSTTECFARILELNGFEVMTALNAATGLAEANTTRPDAIILDLRMPHVDGLAFLQQLRIAPSHQDIPVAIVTGDYLLQDNVADQLKTLGAEIHFKPLWFDDLVTLTSSLVANA